ncbi:MAG: aldehyde ferredoxin oxidoreductase family protein [Desulfobacterales bacterium]|nr:MAG: aldehyde ferredoxin oxidoreductase family protein [Desulfobacterales bacterium]
MLYSFMGKVLRVNLSDGKISEEEIPEDSARKFLGGIGIATKYLYDEVPKGADPLGPENRLILMSGPLTGTISPSAGRYDVVCKSPLTGIWGHANSGGSWAQRLKGSGFDGVILEGISPKPVYLVVQDGKAELRDASHLWGKLVPETQDRIIEELGKDFRVVCIGPAGEKLVRYACLMNEKHRAAGRGGVGTVMGSKRVKAIAVSGKQTPKIANPEEFRQVAKKQYDLLNESMLKVGLESFGTNMLIDMVNAKGGLPTRNWQTGVFDIEDTISAQAMTDKVLESKVNCFACPIACGRQTVIKKGPWAGAKGEGPEYESVVTLGPMTGVNDMEAITKANYLCNEYGLDTISAGNTIGFAMECYEKGLLSDEQTGGLQLKFGDANLMVELTEKIGKREGIGDLLAEGARIMSQKLGKGSEKFAMQVKGLELPAYDPRAAKITGLGYVTAMRGGDHMAGYVQGPAFLDTPFLVVDESKIDDVFVEDPKQVKVLVDQENALTFFDLAGCCKFMGLLLKAEEWVDLVANATGWDFDVNDFRKTGERVYNLVRAYNVREGQTRAHDILPDRLHDEPLPEGPGKGMVLSREKLNMYLDTYYDLRGWDKTTGKPTREKLSELGFENLIGDVWG